MKLSYGWMVLALVLAVASPVKAAEDASLATFRFMVYHGAYFTFLARVSEVEAGNATLEKISIECVKDCLQPISYEEKVAGNVLGIFMLMDAEDIIFSTWSVGDGYAVKIYKIGPAAVTKIFDEHTVLPPDFINVSSLGLIIRTSKFDERADKAKDMPKFIEWRLDGVAFKMVLKKSRTLKTKTH